MNIKARPVATIARSHLAVALTTEPGTVMVPCGPGDRPNAYDAGEVVICGHDPNGFSITTTIAGPLSRADAIALATAVLEGQPRAVTHPQLHLLLAGAVLAFTGKRSDAVPRNGGAPAVQKRDADPPVSPSPEPLPPATKRTVDDQGDRKQEAEP